MTDREIVEAVLRREGVSDAHPNDPGGKTAYGISSRYHPDAWKNGPPTRDQAIAIYLRDYVAPFADVEPVELKAQVIDIAVNCGVESARRMLIAARQQTRRPVQTALVIERLQHYARKIRGNPRLAAFALGWIKRSCEFL